MVNGSNGRVCVRVSGAFFLTNDWAVVSGLEYGVRQRVSGWKKMLTGFVFQSVCSPPYWGRSMQMVAGSMHSLLRVADEGRGVWGDE